MLRCSFVQEAMGDKREHGQFHLRELGKVLPEKVKPGLSLEND